MGKRKSFGRGGIRTHAIEMTGALNQRLRPLGHPTSWACSLDLSINLWMAVYIIYSKSTKKTFGRGWVWIDTIEMTGALNHTMP